jgi:hypothetical protein
MQELRFNNSAVLSQQFYLCPMLTRIIFLGDNQWEKQTA